MDVTLEERTRELQRAKLWVYCMMATHILMVMVGLLVWYAYDSVTVLIAVMVILIIVSLFTVIGV